MVLKVENMSVMYFVNQLLHLYYESSAFAKANICCNNFKISDRKNCGVFRNRSHLKYSFCFSNSTRQIHHADPKPPNGPESQEGDDNLVTYDIESLIKDQFFSDCLQSLVMTSVDKSTLVAAQIARNLFYPITYSFPKYFSLPLSFF